MTVAGAGKQLQQVLEAWPHITHQPHRFGGTEYLIGTREIGHVHRDHLVDIPLTVKMRDEVIAAGTAERHHLLADSGWVSLYLRQRGDIEKAVILFKLSYDAALKQKGLRSDP